MKWYVHYIDCRPTSNPTSGMREFPSGTWAKRSDVELLIAIKNGFESKVEALENGEAYKGLTVEIEYIRERYRGIEKENKELKRRLFEKSYWQGVDDGIKKGLQSEEKCACPTCGCRLYNETGPCKGEDLEKENKELKERLETYIYCNSDYDKRFSKLCDIYKNSKSNEEVVEALRLHLGGPK